MFRSFCVLCVLTCASLHSLEIEYSCSGGMNHERFDKFKKRYNLNTFIETGTYIGETTAIASNYFNQVFTVELDPILYARTMKQLATKENVTCLLGYSHLVLEEILKKHGAASTMIFLDAHYSAGVTIKGVNDPPLLDELEVISKYVKDDTVIIIDDIRDFRSRLTVVKNNYPRVKDCYNFVKENYPDDFEFVIIGDQAVIYNPTSFNDTISEGAKLFTKLYLSENQKELLYFLDLFKNKINQKEEKALYEMSSFPSPMIQYVAGFLKMEKAKNVSE